MLLHHDSPPIHAFLMFAVVLLALPAGPAGLVAAQSTGGSDPAVNPAEGAGAALPAQAEAIPTRNLWQIMRDGGVLMIPIAACSLILMALVFERMISLRRGRIIPRPFVTRFLEQVRDGELDRERALLLCEENGSPVARIFAAAVHKWGRPGVEVEQAVLDAGERATNGLRRYLRVFNGIATVGPLLGLQGTVFGMIQAFNVIAVSDAMGRPELLARGISQALLTTAAGLTVAIPALIVYLYFVSRVDGLIVQIDALGQQLADLISAEELEAKSQRGRTSKPRRAALAPEEAEKPRREEAGNAPRKVPDASPRKAAEGPQRKAA